MKEQIEKLEHGLMICEATGTELVHVEKADAEKNHCFIERAGSGKAKKNRRKTKSFCQMWKLQLRFDGRVQVLPTLRKGGEAGMKDHKVPVQSLIDHIKTAIDVDDWAKEMVEELLKEQPEIVRCNDCKYCEYPEAEKEWCKKGHLHGNAKNWFCADGERRNDNG